MILKAFSGELACSVNGRVAGSVIPLCTSEFFVVQALDLTTADTEFHRGTTQKDFDWFKRPAQPGLGITAATSKNHGQQNRERQVRMRAPSSQLESTRRAGNRTRRAWDYLLAAPKVPQLIGAAHPCAE